MQTNFLQPPYYSTTSPNQSRTSPASKYHLNLQLPSHLRPSARYLQAPAAKSTLVSPHTARCSYYRIYCCSSTCRTQRFFSNRPFQTSHLAHLALHPVYYPATGSPTTLRAHARELPPSRAQALTKRPPPLPHRPSVHSRHRHREPTFPDPRQLA